MFAYFMDGTTILGAGPIPGAPDNTWTTSGYPPVGTDSAAGMAIDNGTTEFGYTFDIDNFAATNIASATIWTYGAGQSNAGYADSALVLDIGGGFLYKVALSGLTVDGANSGSLPGPPAGYMLGGYPDMYGDGVPDVAIFGPPVEGFIFVWDITGCDGTNCTIGQAGPFAGPPAGWDLLGFPDLNGDGTSDVLIRRQSDGVIFAYITGGASGVIGDTPTDATYAGTGDVTGDGNDDIVWDIGNGFLFMWAMDSLTVDAGASGPLPGPPVGTYTFPGIQSLSADL